MPFNELILIAIAGGVLAIGVWFKTKRIGPVIGIMAAAFIVAAIFDPTFISTGGDFVKSAFDWVASNIFTI